MYDEKLKMLNGQIDLIKQRESLMLDRFELLQKEKEENVNKKDSNKEHRPCASYEFCFTVKTKKQLSFLLPTALIRLEVDGLIHGPFRALLDCGAQPTLISHTLFKSLRCATTQSTKKLLGFGSQPFTIKRKMSAIIRPWFESNNYIHDTMLILPHQDTWRPILPSRELNVHRKDKEFRKTLADPFYYLPKEVHILLGVGFVAHIFDHKIGTEIDGTAVFSTMLGNVVMGEFTENWNENSDEIGKVMTVVDDSLGDKLNKMIERLWKQDEIELGLEKEDRYTKEERMVEEHFINTHHRDENGRFVVKIPFKPNIDSIGSSRNVAYRRFKCLEKKLLGSPELKEFYIEQMRELIGKEHMKEVDRAPTPGGICYHIPHHCVLTKPRVVYDASCVTNTGVSLNSVQMLGSKLQTDLHTT